MPEPHEPDTEADIRSDLQSDMESDLGSDESDLAGLDFEPVVLQKGNERDAQRPAATDDDATDDVDAVASTDDGDVEDGDVEDVADAESDDAPSDKTPAATPSPAIPVVKVVSGRRRNLRRRLVSTAVLLTALIGVGGAYSTFAQASGSQSTDSAEQNAQGRQLFEVACITCHGANLQGVTGRGPSLIGTGGAATYFQVATGRMPAVGQNSDERRHHVRYTQSQIDALVAYVQSIGGGPEVPNGDLRSTKNLGEGGELFRLNCASCHGAAGKGAPLSAGKVAPGLTDATDKQIWTALLSGPENMPVFGDNQLTPEQKRDLIGYIQSLKASKDPGGQGLDRIGPVSEGLVIWVAGIGAIVLIILWIGRKAGSSSA